MGQGGRSLSACVELFADAGESYGVVDARFTQFQVRALEIAGGAPLFVSDWSTVGGAQPYTVITQQQFDSLNPVPANGTFVETNTSAVFRIAGGAPMYVSTPVLLGTSVPIRIPTATFRPERPGGCKHAANLRAALAEVPEEREEPLPTP